MEKAFIIHSHDSSVSYILIPQTAHFRTRSCHLYNYLKTITTLECHKHTHTKSDNIHVYAAIDGSLYADVLIFLSKLWSCNSYGLSRLPV